jgi:hypothetical protein
VLEECGEQGARLYVPDARLYGSGTGRTDRRRPPGGAALRRPMLRHDRCR